MERNWGPEFTTDQTAEPETDVPVDEEEEAAPSEVVDHASMQRAHRELEAAKARVQRDATRARDEMRDELVRSLFPLLDNLDRTIAVAEQNGEAPSVVEGVRLVRRQLTSVLEGYGVQRLDAIGESFDPNRHEAISVVAVDDPRGDRRVVDQFEPGYMLGDRLLRPARVVVGRLRYH
jgi:molecular chaperone GrpE (heat shock protein)